MSDYSELLERLDIKQNALSDDAGEVFQNLLEGFLRDFVAALNQERAECAAAIRALIAERDAAALAEREDMRRPSSSFRQSHPGTC